MTRKLHNTAWIAAALLLVPMSQSRAGDLMFGVWTRSACGKVCKLVCEELTLTATCYNCECDQVCVPGPSQRGCKHCAVTHCGENGCAKCEFCWYDWCACGCAQPRSVLVLKKYQTERKVCFYHWEVVDGCTCGPGGPNCGCVYKEAPAESQFGQPMQLTEGERVELANWMAADAAKRKGELADAFKQLPELQVPQTAQAQAAQPQADIAAKQEKPSMFTRFTSLFKSEK
jgi:hypothetical protein